METTEGRDQAASAPRGPRISNACEACRAAKVKCQASTQLGICKRCLGSKRECIFKTGPRTRRPRQPKRQNPTAGSASSSSSTTAPLRYPPPPGPSQTFTIDIPMPADDDITDSLEALRLTHDKAIDMLVPHISDGNEDDYGIDYDQEEMDYDWLDQASASGADGSVLSQASSLPVGASALSTPPSSALPPTQHREQDPPAGGGDGVKASRLRMLASLRLQPQFNLDSAAKLLETFRKTMLSHFHCVVVREEDTVASMARERPFVLLAVLAAASGSRTLQGHSLYDEEFRKILGLKFVAGGERTLELLQGLVIYIAWYPFHLRPRNRQALQYIRMVVDIVSDLELDQDPGTDSMEITPTPERLEQIRLYLASYYLASAFASTWSRSPPLTYTDYTARCCDLIQHHSRLEGDHVLAWQVRLERLVEETNDLRRTQRGHSQSEYQIGLMIRGMETELAEWETNMNPDIASVSSIRIGVLFTRVFLSGAPLLKLPSVKLPPLDSSSAFRADSQRLMSVIPALHELYEYLLSLDPADVNSFVGIEWGALILSVILGFRMSFPLAVCPEWDDRAAREAVRFGEYIDRFCEMGRSKDGESGAEVKASVAAANNDNVAPALGGQQRSMDVLTASKIVLDMVKTKFMRRVAKLEGLAAAQQRQQQQHVAAMLAEAAPHPLPMQSSNAHDPAVGGCPMMDGSLEAYYKYWDETFSNNLVAASTSAATGRPGGADDTGQVGVESAGAGLPNDLWTALTMGWAQEGMSFNGL
ncbi:hypothetical protein N657DRAFT_570671 [Parathielavia appendiculata]|uniref:Zn(2)-C6 fungal-type domain-containing protein n=1 Tax=Parathielavia appendiculata TaxID=2587402 RepID=A0AAN6U3G3_9PEZI|nr:hypothetical protein N657DRAFT_570671 [Parathielavia appendiculata]